jgi:hypothetical protein
MIGDRVAVTGSGHYSVTSYLEVPGEHLVHTGMRPTARCWKVLENGRSQAGRRPFLLVGLPGLEPGTSSLSGTFAGCVQAARALDNKVIGHMSVTVVVRSVPGLSVRCGTQMACSARQAAEAENDLHTSCPAS